MWILEIASWMFAALLVLLDFVVVTVGEGPVLERVPINAWTTAKVTISDNVQAALRPWLHLGLFFGAFVLIVLALALKSARRLRKDLDFLCDAVEKLRDPRSLGEKSLGAPPEDPRASSSGTAASRDDSVRLNSETRH